MIARGIIQEPTIELRPPRVKVLLLHQSDSTDITGPPHAYVTVSIADTVRKLCSLLTATVNNEQSAPARVWKVEGREFNGSLYPSGRLHQDSPEVLTPSDQTLEEAMIEPDDAFVVDLLRKGSFIVDPDKLAGKSGSSSVTVTETQAPLPLFNSGNDFFSKMSKKPDVLVSSSKYASSSKSTEGYFKSAGFGSTITRSQTVTVQEPGTLGLGNM